MSAQADLLGDDDLLPIFILPGEGEKIAVAAAILGYSEKTIRRKAKDFRICSQSGDGAMIIVHMAAMNMVLTPDWTALRLLREDRRDHERVKRHFAHVEKLTEIWLAAQREKARRQG